jgi:hypothetical protein
MDGVWRGEDQGPIEHQGEAAAYYGMMYISVSLWRRGDATDICQLGFAARDDGDQLPVADASRTGSSNRA